jgi:peptidoglycan/LPS O-acetylase OafA/YrhL
MKATAAVHKPSAGYSFAAGQPRIPQLDGLRGIAVLIVVLFHYVFSIPVTHSGFASRVLGCLRLGEYGVDLFFVLSGFLIGGI